MTDLVRTAHRKLAGLNASPFAPERYREMQSPINEWTREQLAIGLLAPDIQKALIAGKAPAALSPDVLLDRDLPLEWHDQRQALGFPS